MLLSVGKYDEAEDFILLVKDLEENHGSFHEFYCNERTLDFGAIREPYAVLADSVSGIAQEGLEIFLK